MLKCSVSLFLLEMKVVVANAPIRLLSNITDKMHYGNYHSIVNCIWALEFKVAFI